MYRRIHKIEKKKIRSSVMIFLLVYYPGNQDNQDPAFFYHADQDPVREPEVAFLNSLYKARFLSINSSFCLVFYPHFSFLQILFLNILEFSFFADFMCVFLKL